MIDIERKRGGQRHRQREKQAPRREPDAGLDSGTPGVTAWADGRRQTAAPPRLPGGHCFKDQTCISSSGLFPATPDSCGAQHLRFKILTKHLILNASGVEFLLFSPKPAPPVIFSLTINGTKFTSLLNAQTTIKMILTD